MALTSGLVEVGTTPTEISFDSQGGLTVLVQNISGADAYLGDENVSTSTGFKLSDGQTVSYDLLTDDSLYAIIETDNINLNVTWLGR